MSVPILFLLNSLTIGGSERKTIYISNRLREKGWEVHLGYLSGPETLKSEIAKEVNVVNFSRKWKFDPFVIKRISDYISRNSIRILICVNLYPSMYGAFLTILKKDDSFNSISFINKTNFYSRYEKYKMLFYTHVLKRMSTVVFGCYKQKQEWIERYRLDESRSTHIYNGVNCSYFSPRSPDHIPSSIREQYGFSESDLVIVNVSRFSLKKNQGELIEACETLLTLGYPVRLVLVGDGPERRELMARVAESGFADKIFFPGQVLDVRPILGAADIFVLPSAADTFSNATLEAMAMEKPVILADVAGASEMVVSGRNGFLYPASETGKLTEILKLLAEDESKRLRMGQEGRRMAEDYFEFNGMIDNYEALLVAASTSKKFISAMVSQPIGIENEGK